MSFEKWFGYDKYTTLALEISSLERRHRAEGWNAAVSEMSQPQSADTCKVEHPRWALVEGTAQFTERLKTITWAELEGKSYYCSICAELRAPWEQVEKLEKALTQLPLVHILQQAEQSLASGGDGGKK